MRVRFAPSPTGFLHVGGARTALFNWLFARKQGGQFLLRIEDTDKARSTDASTQAIFDGLAWLELGCDEPVVYQGANLARHQSDARALLSADAAYRCFCTAAELDARRKDAESRGEVYRYDRLCDRIAAPDIARRVAAGEPHALRFRVPEGRTSWRDMVHGEIVFDNNELDDLIILRSDGTPIYNLAVVSDDITMRITHVMRGDDHISNTPKQILLYRALGATPPVFAHFPMIHGLDGKKLSKRHGATAVGDYRHMGILPDAMANFLALLGWSPGDDIEVMNRAELLDRFSPDGFLKKSSVFDPAKLEWMNGQHLMRMPLERLFELVVRALTDAGIAPEADMREHHVWTSRLIELLRVRARTVDDLVRQARPYFGATVSFDDGAVAQQWKDPAVARRLLALTRETLAAHTAWDATSLEPALRRIAEAEGIGAGKVLQPLRVALTGVAASPGIFDVLELLGRDRSLARIDAALAHPHLAG